MSPAAVVPRAEGHQAPRLHKVQEGIVKAELPPHALVDEESAAELREQLLDMAGGSQLAVVLQITGVVSVSRAALAEFGAIPSVTAWAVVGESPVDRLIGHYMLRFRFGAGPAQYFDCEDAAITWLASPHNAD